MQDFEAPGSGRSFRLESLETGRTHKSCFVFSASGPPTALPRPPAQAPRVPPPGGLAGQGMKNMMQYHIYTHIIHIYIYIERYIYRDIHTHTHTYIDIYIYICNSVYIYIYIEREIQISTHMYTCVYIYRDIYIYIYVYTHMYVIYIYYTHKPPQGRQGVWGLFVLNKSFGLLGRRFR